MRACFLAAVSVVIWSHPVVAQVSPAAPGPQLVATWSDSWEPPSLASTPHLGIKRARVLGRGAKWIGGALVVGTLSAAVANALCERRECTGPTVTWGLIGAAAGAALGGLMATATD